MNLKEEMIEMITKAVKHTHNEQDLKDLNEMSRKEVTTIFEELFVGRYSEHRVFAIEEIDWKEFTDFVNDGNVEKIDGLYSTQCSVWKNRLTFEELLQYVIKEYYV